MIVGAGMAGLTAAYRLHQAGVGCRLFEARQRVGGRCWSSHGWRGGMVGEHGAEWVDTRHVHLRGLAEELGVALVDLWGPAGDDVDPPIWMDGAWTVPDENLTSLQELSDELARLARSNGPFLASEATRAASAFDEMTAADWITQATGQSMGSPIGRLLTLRMAGWYGLDPEQLGAPNLVDLLVAQFPGDDVRFSLDGGADRIPNAMADQLPAGTITFGAALTSIRRAADGTFVVRFDGMAQPVAADHLIVAVPFSVLKEVELSDAGLSPIKRRAIDELLMGSNAKLLIELDRPFEELDEGWTGVVERADDPLYFAWESSSALDDRGRAVALLTVFSGGSSVAAYEASDPHAVPADVVVERTLASLNEMLPGISDASTGSSWLDVWEQDPWARGSYAAFGPGQMTSFLGRIGQAEGRMHFAGEHTSLYSQGYLDGAVESGDRVAGEVLDAIGRPRPQGVVLARQRRVRYEPMYPWTT